MNIARWRWQSVGHLSRETIKCLRKLRDEQLPTKLILEDGEEIDILVIAVGRAKEVGPGYHLVWEEITKQ
jgi:hypothetical protein